MEIFKEEIMHTKTTLTCSKCKKPIYSDEGFTTKKNKHFHAESCEVILKPHQCKQYKPDKSLEKIFFTLPEYERV